jgi:hypothetical protein
MTFGFEGHPFGFFGGGAWGFGAVRAVVERGCGLGAAFGGDFGGVSFAFLVPDGVDPEPLPEVFAGPLAPLSSRCVVPPGGPLPVLPAVAGVAGPRT